MKKVETDFILLFHKQVMFMLVGQNNHLLHYMETKQQCIGKQMYIMPIIVTEKDLITQPAPVVFLKKGKWTINSSRVGKTAVSPPF